MFKTHDQIKNRKNICKWKNTLRILLLKVMKLILIFMSIMKKNKIKVDENGHSYILFRVDVYFSESILAVEADEKGHTNRDLIFEKKGKKH